jgi:NitT/TauT family transport system substrate-binding protein
LLVLLLGVVIGGWGVIRIQGGGGSLRALPPLRIAISPWPGYEFATLARELGYFEEEGVRVRLVELSSLGDCRRAFERGQVDGFFGTVVELVHAEQQSERTPRAVMVTDTTNGADVILARNGIETVQALRGLRVGVESGSLNVYVLARALELNSMAWSDVTTLHVSLIEMPAALAGGEVDAVVTYPPISTEILREGGGGHVFCSAEIPGEVVDLLAFDDAVLDERAAQVEAFRRAFFRAQAYAREHPDHAYAVMAARQRITPEEFAAALADGIELLGPADQEAYLGDAGRMPELIAMTRRVLEQAAEHGVSGRFRSDLAKVREE